MKRSTLILSTVFGVFITISGVYLINTSEHNMKVIAKHNAQTAREALREWKTTREGVRYFETCVGDHLMIGTKSTHGHTQLAGPMGKCDG